MRICPFQLYVSMFSNLDMPATDLLQEKCLVTCFRAVAVREYCEENTWLSRVPDDLVAWTCPFPSSADEHVAP